MSAPAAVGDPAPAPESQAAASAVPRLRDAGDVVHLRRPAGPLGRAAALFVEPRMEPAPDPPPPSPPYAAPRARGPGAAGEVAPRPRRAGPLGRAAALFVEPRMEPAPDPPPPSPPYAAPRAAVLGRRTEALPLAAALANAMRAGHAAAAVAAWSPDRDSASPDRDSAAPEPAPALAADAASGPATSPRGREPIGGFAALPAAARLATRLTGRGLTAVARGRLAWIELPAHPLAAAPAARRANAAVDAPLVLVVTGPRCDTLDVLLEEQDVIVVVTGDPDGPLARLAIEASPVPAVACPPLAGPARLLALAGLAGRRALGANLRAATEGGP